MSRLFDVSDAPIRGASCAAGRSIVKALNSAAEILSREFSLTKNRLPFPLKEGGNCSAIQKRWVWYTDSARAEVRGDRSRMRFVAAVKGCKRLFDVACPTCDKCAARRARNAWMKGSSADCSSGNRNCLLYVERLKTHVRELTRGWGVELDRCRKGDQDPVFPSDVYVPDQQGCFEMTRGTGGTLAVSVDAESSEDGLLRVGVAKQKGKFRVVTMQGARVKRVLRPVHNALYDHLSRFGWLVRGDVTSDDFLSVRKAAGGEEIISGDYTAATDKIYLPAVRAVVDVLAEELMLTDEERTVLIGSFDSIRWRSESGVEHPITRGSMMGNLVSFPILCILNKACHDMATDDVYGVGVRRVGRFNGDDCLFAGNPAMYQRWRFITSVFGFEVNELKTMVSRRWADLNSQTFDLKRGTMVSKPVLSFLLRSRDSPGEILSDVLSGISSFSKAVQLWVVNVVMRYEISLRGFTLSSIPSGWARVLVKRKWFRSCVWRGPAEARTRVQLRTHPDGTWYEGGRTLSSEGRLAVCDRSFPTTIGPPPRPECLPVVEECHALLSQAHTEAWRGVPVIPSSPFLDRRSFRAVYDQPSSSFPPTRFVGVAVRWGFLWPTSLLEEFTASVPHLLLTEQECLVKKSYPYSPLLVLRHSYRVVRKKRSFPPVLNPLSLSSPRYSPFYPSWLIQVS